jgi:Flp pilus assembly protein TadD
MKKETFDEATAEYQAVLRLKPEDYRAMNGLGAAYARAGKLDMAIDLFKRAGMLQSTDPDPWYNLTLTYEKKGMIDQAILSCQKAIEIKPDHWDAHRKLALLYYRKGDREKAKEEFMKYRHGKQQEKIAETIEEMVKKLKPSRGDEAF